MLEDLRLKSVQEWPTEDDDAGRTLPGDGGERFGKVPRDTNLHVLKRHGPAPRRELGLLRAVWTSPRSWTGSDRSFHPRPRAAF